MPRDCGVGEREKLPECDNFEYLNIFFGHCNFPFLDTKIKKKMLPYFAFLIPFPIFSCSKNSAIPASPKCSMRTGKTKIRKGKHSIVKMAPTGSRWNSNG